MFKNSLSTLVLLLALVLGITLSSCAQPTAQPTQPEKPSGEQSQTTPRKGGEITLIIPEEPTLLNVYLTDAAIARQVADATSQTGLVEIDPQGNVRPKLAESLPSRENGGVSEDYKTITWKLRPNLKWSDGKPLTSDDVKFTWKAVTNPQSGVLYLGGFDKLNPSKPLMNEQCC
jgi:peptide/nickel transport system substrate-binding protein